MAAYSCQVTFARDALHVLAELIARGIDVDRLALAREPDAWLLEFSANVDLQELQRAIRRAPHGRYIAQTLRVVPASKTPIPPRRVTLTIPERADWRCEGLAYE